MKKNKWGKRIAAAFLAIGCVVSLAGCGKKDTGADAQSEKKEKDYVYSAQYETVDIEGDFYSSTVVGDKLYFPSWDNDEANEIYKQKLMVMTLGETTAEQVPVELPEKCFIMRMTSDSDGNLIFVANMRVNDDPCMMLYKYSPDGTQLLGKDIAYLGQDAEYFYISYMATDAENNIYLTDGESSVWVLDSEGNEKATMPVENWIMSMFRLPNGKVAISTWTNEGKTVFQEVEAASGAKGKVYANVPDMGSDLVSANGDLLYISAGNVVYEYDLESQTKQELFDWVSCDMNSDYVSKFVVLEDGRFFVILEDYSSDEPKVEFAYLTRQDASQVVEKEEITLGTIWLDQSVKENVIAFNKESDKYRIEVIEYGADDYEAGLTQLNADIVAGKGPDIIDLSFGNANMYAAQGILEDLTPYVEADLNQEDYIENVFQSYTYDGKMYGVVPSFSIMTVVGKTADVGETPGWTIDDVMALAQSKPEGTEIFSYCDKEMMLYYLCSMSTDSFIDWETGECYFNDGYFEKVLTFANEFPKEVNYDEEESTPSKIQSGKLLLLEAAISDVQSYQMHCAMFGEPITCIGFPSNGQSGTYISATGGLGINSQAQCKEGAWEFIKSFLSEEYQNENIEWDFPVLRSALEERFAKDMTPEYETIDGEQVECPKTTWGYEDFEVDIYAATQEDIDAMWALIESADIVAGFNEDIYNMILEEATPYFEGQKSAKEVADIVQSRVKIYVNENR